MSGGPAAQAAGSVVLAGLLVFACTSDLRHRRIPNVVVFATLVAGLAFAVVTKRDSGGLTTAAIGFAAGFGIWFPFYLVGMVGAGDVKLFAAAATFLGARGAVEGALYTALFGGALALTYMLLSSGWVSTGIRLGQAIQNPSLLRNPLAPNRLRVPYALAIAGGVFVAFLWPGHIVS